MPAPPTITTLIASSMSGERVAADALFSALYAELHGLAERQLAGRGSGVALGATTLLHEAYLEISQREGTAFPDRGRFMGYAAKVMRGLIIDYARSQQAQKRGGEFLITTFDEETGIAPGGPLDVDELDAINGALEKLAFMDRTLAEVVDLKFFCGFSVAEIASMQGLSERTVQRRWEKARVFLRREIRGTEIS